MATGHLLACKNLCKKGHIYWTHVLRSWSVTSHGAIFMRAHRSHVSFQHWEKLAFRSTSFASTSGHYKSYNCCSFSFCSGPYAPQSQMDDLPEPQCSSHGFSVRVLFLPSGCLLGFYWPAALAFSLILDGIVYVSLRCFSVPKSFLTLCDPMD